MRLKYTCFIFLLIVLNHLKAQSIRIERNFTPQTITPKLNVTTDNLSSKKNKGANLNLTGIWRGYFVQKDFDLLTGAYTQEKYKFEIQINQLKDDAIEGVTYSYKNTVFYVKASMQGLFTRKTNNLIIKELKIIEKKIIDNSVPCVMTCYLDYLRNDGKEVLMGDYTSVNITNKKDCGEGTVYLEKVKESNFEKEPFLQKKETAPKNLATNEDKKVNTNIGIKLNVEVNKPKYKPGAEDALIKPNIENKLNNSDKEIDNTSKIKIDSSNNNLIVASPLAKVLTERQNNMTVTLQVDEKNITVDLYDNGAIDDDTISVYHNGEPVILNQRLSEYPISLNIKIDAQHPKQELVMVAENLGRVPPNSSLMIATFGKKKYQVNITSDLQKNAKIVFEYIGK